MAKAYRRGAVGALLDEYERAIADLIKCIETIPEVDLTKIIDPHTDDENCRSVQSILSHVVHAGMGYATSIYDSRGHQMERPAKTFHVTMPAYIRDLNQVFSFTEEVFSGLKDRDLEQPDQSLKIKTNWGQYYDIEQLTEHAIVHILRHRRQIEKLYLMR